MAKLFSPARHLPLPVLALLASGCLEPASRGSLELEVRGPAYPRPRCAKGVAALGALHPLGEPVVGAPVELSPGGVTGVTDAEGKLKLEDLPEDNYTAAVRAPGFKPQELVARVRRGKATALAAELTPCVSAGPDRLRVGFDEPIALVASATACGADWDGASFVWTKLEGPEIGGSVSSWSGASLRFVTAKLEDVRPLPDRPQLLSFSHDEAGEYVFQVSARSKSGVTARDTVLVTSTNVTGGLNSVPPYDRYYFLGEKEGPWEWQATKWPPGWQQTLEGATTRTPSVRPIPNGPLTVQQTIVLQDVRSRTMLTFSLVVGSWDQVNRDCGRSGCHPPLQQSWERTRHATTWRKLVD